MKLKQRIEDFRVRELVSLDVEGKTGEHRVYRVTKRKLTSLEAAGELAREAGVPPQAVSMAGLKDRQGVTIQHMSLPRGPVVELRRPDLRIETLGRIPRELAADASEGNAFQIVVRALDGDDLAFLREGLASVRRDGLVNYFDEQRFGNLRHEQGWIYLDLVRGRVERALQTLVAAPSPFDDRRNAAFKRGLRAAWGDWRGCRELAGKFGAHHSLFEHLKANPEDFAGAFGHVATRLRLIHLYAFQSHLWNRAVTELVRELAPIEERIVVRGQEGPLVFASGPLALPPTVALPGERLEGVDERIRGHFEDALAALRLVPAELAVEGVPGFALKAEERATLVHPRHLRVRPAEPDEENRGLRKVRVRFELPRGAYATLLVRRLLSRALGEREGAADEAPSTTARGGRGRREGHGPREGHRRGDPDGARRERRDRGPGREDRGPGFGQGRGPRPQRAFEGRGGRDPSSDRDRGGDRGPSGRGGRGRDDRGRDQRGFGGRGHRERGDGGRGHGKRDERPRSDGHRGDRGRGGRGDRGPGDWGRGDRGPGDWGRGGQGRDPGDRGRDRRARDDRDGSRRGSDPGWLRPAARGGRGGGRFEERGRGPGSDRGGAHGSEGGSRPEGRREPRGGQRGGGYDRGGRGGYDPRRRGPGRGPEGEGRRDGGLGRERGSDPRRDGHLDPGRAPGGAGSRSQGARPGRGPHDDRRGAGARGGPRGGHRNGGKRPDRGGHGGREGHRDRGRRDERRGQGEGGPGSAQVGPHRPEANPEVERGERNPDE